MQLNSKNIWLLIICFVVVAIAILALPIIKHQQNQLILAQSTSSLMQVYFWVNEYEEKAGRKPDEISVIILNNVSLHPTDEFDELIYDLKNGKATYDPNPISGNPMIQWKKGNYIIELMVNGHLGARKIN